MNVEGAFRLTSRSGCEEAVDQGIGGRVVNAGLYHYRINVRGRVPASNAQDRVVFADADGGDIAGCRSEEHTSELQSLMRISYAVFCLQNKKDYKYKIIYITQ